MNTSIASADQPLITFLDDCERQFGKDSVLYVSFGSLFFPAAYPDQIRTLVHSLTAARPPIPFVFAVSTAPPELVSEIKKMIVEENATALVSMFAPQMDVLQHAATGWFLVSIWRLDVEEKGLKRCLRHMVDQILCLRGIPVFSVNLDAKDWDSPHQKVCNIYNTPVSQSLEISISLANFPRNDRVVQTCG